MYDCIIVGAGPAGGSAAYHLAKRGRSVLVLEKAGLPRYKPCGGGVSPQVAEWFDFDFTPAISLHATEVCYTWQMDDPVRGSLKEFKPVWMVRRDVFDHFLIQQAQKQGAELRDNTEVTGIAFKSDRWQVQTATEPVEGRYLIAADGSNGVMAQWLGFKDRKRRLAATLEAEALLDAGTPDTIFFEFGMVKNGCIWNFPKADGYSISIGTFIGGSGSQDFNTILTSYAQKFNLDVPTCTYHEHPLRTWDGNQTLHTENALLAGDTACLVDPFTAEGIRPALFSGMNAAEAIDGAIAGDPNALANYTNIMANEWGKDMGWAKKLASLFYRTPKLSYQIGVKRPSATTRMGQLLSGELRYRDVANRAIKRLTTGMLPGGGRK